MSFINLSTGNRSVFLPHKKPAAPHEVVSKLTDVYVYFDTPSCGAAFRIQPA